MENLQKIIVLCAVLLMGILIGAQFVDAPVDEAVTQIEPSSLDQNSGPDDVSIDDVDSPGEPTRPLPANDEPVACTMDAKQCPDGSYVGRTGPNCAFALCPSGGDVQVDSFEDCVAAGNPVMESYPRGCNHNGQHFVEEIEELIEVSSIMCTPESKQVNGCYKIYQPVCGLVEVQCFTEPCYPEPRTFGNDCEACRQGNVLSYTEGACSAG